MSFHETKLMLEVKTVNNSCWQHGSKL